MKFRPHGYQALSFFAVSAALAGLFASCGQNPGQTGLDYLDKQGVQLSAPLYHLSFENFPLDSVFAREVPLNHFGESLLVVGREHGFVAAARMGFRISTPAQRDSLAQGLHLRLSSLTLGSETGRDFLLSSAEGRDSLTLLVESFSWPDSTKKFGDSLTAFHRRILFSPVPFSTLEQQYITRDTIRISLSGAYPSDGGARDSSQARALPRLRERLRTGGGSDTAREWAVFLEISPVGPDSGMFRFIAQAGGNNAALRAYNSALWLGRYNGDSLAQVGMPLYPYRSGLSSVPAANYEVRHTGASSRSLLYGVARGVHFRINRERLLDSIQARLGAQFPGAAPAGKIDRRFYVPYAAIRLPLDSALSRVDGPFALDMLMVSDSDSLGTDTAKFQDTIAVALNGSVGLPVQGGGAYGAVPIDTLVVSYQPHPADPSLRRVLLRWAAAPSVADTFTLVPDGRHRELAMRRRSGWQKATTLGVDPEPAQLRVGVFFNVQSAFEPRHKLDSAGKEATSPASLSPRFWRPGADSLSVRATRGIRAVLNRNHASGIGVAPDLFLFSEQRAVYDTSLINNVRYRRVGYPVLGEIDFKRADDGRVEVGLELYLYPLEGGQ